MSHANLTARYRPQTFSELAGQDTVRTILSRAAAENSVAPAYLFSGTRGVGKTTVARVFAKALNCVHAPTAEPCNECENCRQITTGTAVDVVEIDGASNGGVNDVRKLKEVIGYAPMQGRYKIFIIDEAHMLSREAFNALLKTLEEPPANVTFIMATTEAHKFPATIISRCQHYVFKRLSENGLEEHLSKVLTKENVPFEEGAVRLLARRAAGSVRDAMSLLGQVLALGNGNLTEQDTRMVLGLAGQELFFTLFRSLRNGNNTELTKLIAEMLDSGLDLGFFLREMALCWRNMFMLRQSGSAALSILDIPAKEADRWQEEAASFTLAHIHAAWQMTIDSQHRVLTSLEPALALELLLCNIAMLPRLLPLEGVARLGRAGQLPVSDSGTEQPSPPVTVEQVPGQALGQTPNEVAKSPTSADAPSAPGSALIKPNTPGTVRENPSAPVPLAAQEDAPDPFDVGGDEAYLASMTEDLPPDTDSPFSEESVAPASLQTPAPSGEEIVFPTPADGSWSAFLRFCKQRQGMSPALAGMLRTVSGEWKDTVLELTPSSIFCAEQMQLPETAELLSVLVREHYGPATAITLLPPPKTKTAAEIKEAIREHPAVHLLEKELGARLVDYGQQE